MFAPVQFQWFGDYKLRVFGKRIGVSIDGVQHRRPGGVIQRRSRDILNIGTYPTKHNQSCPIGGTHGRPKRIGDLVFGSGTLHPLDHSRHAFYRIFGKTICQS